MRISVIGTTDFENKDLLYKELDKETISVLVSLPSIATHKIVEEYAVNNKIKLEWGDPVAKAEKVILLYDPNYSFNKSTMARVKQLNKKIKIIKYQLI